MDRRKRNKMLVIFSLLAVILLAGIIVLRPEGARDESIQEVMRDVVLHEANRVSFMGTDVAPGLAAGILVTVIMSIFAVIVRIFFIPKFSNEPGPLQIVMEEIVGIFDGMSRSSETRFRNLLGAYIFTAGSYIFVGTLLELLGIPLITTKGGHLSMPAPLSDVNGAIMMGCTSYLFIMVGGILAHGPKGVLKALKDFSLPISMSFRLFGALLSGALVTELVYYYISLSFVLPVVVGVMFTCLHAIIQAYVLTMLVSMFFGEMTKTTKN